MWLSKMDLYEFWSVRNRSLTFDFIQHCDSQLGHLLYFDKYAINIAFVKSKSAVFWCVLFCHFTNAGEIKPIVSTCATSMPHPKIQWAKLYKIVKYNQDCTQFRFCIYKVIHFYIILYLSKLHWLIWSLMTFLFSNMFIPVLPLDARLSVMFYRQWSFHIVLLVLYVLEV